MKILISLLCLTSFHWVAEGSPFGFSDPAGFEKCLSTDHLIVESRTAQGSEKKFLDVSEIKSRCIASAATLLKNEKKRELLLAYVKVARAGANALICVPLVRAVATNDPTLCNEMALYEVFTKALSFPPSDSPSVNQELSEAKQGVKSCLRDAQFKKDFAEEMDSSNADLARNACEVLKEAKVIKSCKGKA